MRSNSRHLRTWPHKLNYSYMGHWSKESVLKYKNTKQNKTKINVIIYLNNVAYSCIGVEVENPKG